MRDILTSHMRLVILILLLISCLFATAIRPVKIPILMYHHIRTVNISDEQMLKDTSCSPARFVSHLNYLISHNYTTVTFVDVQNYLFGLDTLPAKPIILTFDDGYDNNFWAAQKLRQKKMRGVFFVVTKTLNTPEHLSSNNIQKMSEWGMEIGSHGKYHADLRKIRFDKVPLQMAESKIFLEKIIGLPVISFCYAAGGYNWRISKACQEAGFWFARTTRPGITTIYGKNQALRTLRIDDKTTLTTLEKLLKK